MGQLNVGGQNGRDPVIVVSSKKRVVSFSEQLASTGATLQASRWMNGTVIVDSTVGNDTLFLITWTVQPPQILLWDPSGKKQEGFVVDTNTKMAYLPIPGTAKVCPFLTT